MSPGDHIHGGRATSANFNSVVGNTEAGGIAYVIVLLRTLREEPFLEDVPCETLIFVFDHLELSVSSSSSMILKMQPLPSGLLILAVKVLKKSYASRAVFGRRP